MKPTSNYKMSAAAKRYLATIDDKHTRGLIKNVIIDAELTAQYQPRRSKVVPTFNENLTD